MTLNLTSAVKVREPGFSRSECLELARRIDIGDIVVGDVATGEDFTESQAVMIVAALRTYASE